MMDKEQVKKEAREIMQKFARQLEKVKLKEEKIKKPLGGFREERSGKSTDEKFRKAMFTNAQTKGDFLISEKRKWQ